MRRVMEPIIVGNRQIKFAFDTEGNEYGYYADEYTPAAEEGAAEQSAQITKADLSETIDKLVKCGKSLPQRDRIRGAMDQAAEALKVTGETINLWWEIFSKQHISVRLWAKATEKAMIINGIPRLDVSLISPTLMQAALQECQKDYVLEQEASGERYKQEAKKPLVPADCPEIGIMVKYHMRKHKRPLLPLPEPEKVKAWAIHGGMAEDVAEKNMLQLRIYYCFGQHAKRDKEPVPVRLMLDQKKHAFLEFVS